MNEYLSRSNQCLTLSIIFALAFAAQAADDVPRVGRFNVHEVTLQSRGDYANPYTDVTAEATLTDLASGTMRAVPLFWDGDKAWKFRFAPDRLGTWKWVVRSADAALNGQTGGFEAVASNRPGSIRPMSGFPLHFARQDGSRFWFLGDTAWAYYTDNADEKHDRDAAFRYIDVRAGQGFNVVHSMLLSEAGWGNRGGPPWDDIATERLNPGYWKEVDVRMAHANSRAVVCGLALAWGDKRKVEPFAWRKFPDPAARKRYARYVAARYSAYDVYFIVSGEWHGEVRTRPSTDEVVRQEFIEIGEALHEADPHGRMVAIHPMTAQGSVREFNSANWMTFGDYQQNYRDLHGRVLESRKIGEPVVNSEYGYFLRDQSGDGVPDKDNSTSANAMRHATWDIVMAGGYVVTGFGTTYFGGNRDPGPFDLDAKKNDVWESQIGHVRRVFLPLEWWKLEPNDNLLTCDAPREQEGREFNQTVPPAVAYWCLAEAGRQYVFYVRGVKSSVKLVLPPRAPSFSAMQFNPRTGERKDLGTVAGRERYEFQPPNDEDWVVLLTAAGP
jgi:hypothetical protein